MAPVNPSPIPTAADFDVIQNRVLVALAKRERLIKSWTASSSRPRQPLKTQEELEAEDAELFNLAPASLGLGAPIPKEFLDGDVKRKEIWNNERLRNLFMGKRVGSQASKSSDGKERACGAKRSLDEKSSDEDEGRSALGKAKKSKNGISPSMTMNPFKNGTKPEVKAEVKSTSKQKGLPDHGHVDRSDAKPQGKLDMRTEVLQKQSSLQNLKLPTTSRKISLVDYKSDDEGDENDEESTAVAAQKQQSATSNVAPACSSPSVEPVAEAKRSTVSITKSEATITNKSSDQPSLPAVSNEKEPAQLEGFVSNDSIEFSAKPFFKGSSSHSSKSQASSTESEPSDMETAIPLSLTPDVIERTTLPAIDDITSVNEARRAKRRQRRARRKEKEQQRKALASSIAFGGAEKPVITSTGGTSVAKKIKDRLLDANGN